jgi:hypothetical protein
MLVLGQDLVTQVVVLQPIWQQIPMPLLQLY